MATLVKMGAGHLPKNHICAALIHWTGTTSLPLPSPQTHTPIGTCTYTCTCMQHTHTLKSKTGEMGQLKLIASVALAEDPVAIWWFITIHNSSTREGQKVEQEAAGTQARGRSSNDVHNRPRLDRMRSQALVRCGDARVPPQRFPGGVQAAGAHQLSRFPGSPAGRPSGRGLCARPLRQFHGRSFGLIR